jgi:EAL and modified HD-GYP domain-containing signal transduction protein
MPFARDAQPGARRPPTSAGHGSGVMIGRQPILDRTRRVIGYELVCNATALDEATPREAARRTAEGILEVGLDRLVRNRRAFLEVPPTLLEDDLVKQLPATAVVVEVPCSTSLDTSTIEAYRRLTHDGYALALKDFFPECDAAALLPMADFVTVDASADDHARQACLDAGVSDVRLRSTIATRVEGQVAFTQAMEAGFSHAQGYFFTRAVNVESRPVPRGQVGALRLLYVLSLPHLSLNDLEDLIKHDASLCYRLLRAVNSVVYAQTREVTSIRQALLLMGLNTIRRWASLWVIADLGAESHAELVTLASIRGRFCELVAARRFGPDAGGEGFLLGMVSCLDAILQREMSAILNELPVSTDVSAALLGRDNPSRQLLDCVVAYMRGDWSAALPIADALGVQRAWLPTAHADALGWAIEPGTGTASPQPPATRH